MPIPLQEIMDQFTPEQHERITIRVQELIKETYMPEVDYTDLAQEAYNVYAASMNFQDAHGKQMVAYSDTSVEYKRAWEAAIKSAVDKHEASKAPVENVSRFAEAEADLSPQGEQNYANYQASAVDEPV